MSVVRPRVLFVSRERIRLPLAGAQERKWAAVENVVEPRVLAAAPAGAPTRGGPFRLAAPTHPRFADGVRYYLALPLRIARELRAFHPDAALVQGVHEAAAFLVARSLARSRTRFILDVQGDWREATRLYGSSFRRLLNPVNDALPAAVFPSYVDAAAFLERPPAALPDKPRAVFVGVLERYKALDTLIEAWRRAAPQVPQAVLHVVGDGTLRESVRALVEDLPAQTEWSQRLDPEAVSRAMDDSWLVCLPSRSEGLPRVALEGACRGRAIVGGNRAGIPDVVHDGENGLLVDPDDADGLARALVRILSDRAEAERLGAAARRTGEGWVVTPDEYGARVQQLVVAVLAG